jgi:hypothetical protein
MLLLQYHYGVRIRANDFEHREQKDARMLHEFMKHMAV